MKKLLLLLLIGFFINCGSGGKENSALKEISVRLPIPIVDSAFVPFYIGQDKGIFNKYGLKVKLEPGSTVLNPVKMVSAGINSFGVLGGPELLMTGKDKGARIIGIALIHKNSDFVIVLTKKNSAIKKVTDLNNKKVGFFYGHISTDILHALFKKENVEVKEVDVGFNYNLFIADKLPAQWAFRTTAGLTLPAKGISLNVISPAEYGIETHGHTLIANEDIVNNDPKTVISFLRALKEATEYSIKHIDESIASVLKRNKKFNKETANLQLEIYNRVILQNKKLLWIDEDTLISTRKRLVDLKLISNKLNVKDYINNSFIKNIYK